MTINMALSEIKQQREDIKDIQQKLVIVMNHLEKVGLLEIRNT
jgi:hypothetical protein